MAFAALRSLEVVMAGYKLSASILNRKRSPGKLTDGGALFFYRNKDGTLTAWQRVAGKDVRVRNISGEITQAALSEIRAEAYALKSAPSSTEEKRVITFEMAWESFRKKMAEATNSKWSQHTLDQATARMWNYVSHTEIWNMPVSEITSDHVLQSVAPARERYPKLAPKVIALIGQVLSSVAGKEGLAINAAKALKDELKSTERRVVFERHPAITDLDGIGKLLYAIDNCKSTLSTRVAMTLQAYSAQRTGEVVGAMWSEFSFQEDGSVIWTIPRARMKVSDAQSKPYDQVLHLTQSVTKQLNRLERKGDYLFRPRFGKSDHIRVESLPNAYWEMGYKGIAVPHGWRSSLKTLAEDSLDEDERPLFAPSWIEAVLDHSPRGVSVHYHRAKTEKGMKRVLSWWGALLDGALDRHTRRLLNRA